MLLYIIRHGEAENAILGSDEKRELTKHGREVTRAMGELLREADFEKPDLVIASPLIRAQQTADIIRETFAKKAKFETSEALKPDAPLEQPMSLIASRAEENDVIAIFGHDPQFSALASALTGGPEGAIAMKKSGVALFEITRLESPRMRGTLKTYLTPKILRIRN